MENRITREKSYKMKFYQNMLFCNQLHVYVVNQKFDLVPDIFRKQILKIIGLLPMAGFCVYFFMFYR